MSSLDLDDAESLRRAYVDEGRSLSAIAEMTGCSYASVRRALLAQGIQIRRSGPEPIGDLRDRTWLTARVSEGMSANDIAERLGCAEGTVRSALQWAGLATGQSRERPPALADAAFLERAYLAEGRSVRSIAEEVGATKDAVLAALRTHGVPIRSRGRVTRPAAAMDADGQHPPASQDDAVVEDAEPLVPVGSETGPEPPLEPEQEPNSLLVFLDDAYARVRGEPSPEPAPAPANEPVPERETDVDLAPRPEPDPDPEADPEPIAFELELPPLHPERSRPVGATLASFPHPSSESVPEPPPSAAPAPTQHDTGASVMTTTKPPAATESEPPPASSDKGGSSPLVDLPTKIDLEIDKIETKTFPVARRGYDRQEVDAFLRSIAKDYRQVVKSAKDAVNAARAAAAKAAPVATAPTPPTPPRTTNAFEDIGSRVTAVLTSAAEAADEIRAAAEKEALAMRQRAREEAEQLRSEAAESLAEIEQTRAATEREAADAEAAAQAQADLIVTSARQRAEQLEEEARERITTTDRKVRANIDAAIAEARRDYEHLRSAQQQCIDRLASVEFLAKHARDGLSENVGQSIDELL